MQKACCVLKNEKSEKKDPKAFIRNSEKSASGLFHIYTLHNIICMQGFIAEKDLRNEGLFLLCRDAVADGEAADYLL